MKRIALIVGHTKIHQGANNYLGQTEYTWNTMVAQRVAQYIKEKSQFTQVRVFFRDSIGRAGVATLIKEWNADLSLELHFNSFKQTAYGCEVLVLKGDKRSIRIADHLSDKLEQLFLVKQRDEDGVKELDDGDRGYYNLKLLQSLPIAMLVEPCFANKKTAESRAIFENTDKYAEVLADELLWAVHESDTKRNEESDIPRAYPADPNNEREVSYLHEVNRLGFITDELKQKNDQLHNIIKDQNEGWTELSCELSKALEILSSSVDKMIEVSTKTWKENN